MRKWKTAFNCRALYDLAFFARHIQRTKRRSIFFRTCLSSGRGSRLQSKLVYDKQIAQNVFASNQTREIAGTFQVVATAAKKDASLAELESEINAEIERIKKDPPTAEEMERAINGIESQTIFGLQNILGKANQMNGYATFLNKPDYFPG